MIETLTISNYALIDNIELRFSPGFNVITGETGAGKSVMLNALSMLLGGRSDSKVVSDPQRKSIVEASFRNVGSKELNALFTSSDIEWGDNTIILRREITPSGRSRAFVNDTPVSISVMREIALRLVDLHSQHSNLLLADPAYQLEIIDNLLPDKSIQAEYTAAFKDYKEALRLYNQSKRQLQVTKDEEEYLRFQYARLVEASLSEGEQSDLERERNMLSDVSTIKESLSHLENIFQSVDPSILSLLNEANSASLALKSVDGGEEICSRLEQLSIEAKDIASTIETMGDKIESDPRRLEYVEDRLSEIYNLQRKHKVDDVESLIAIRDTIANRLNAIDTADDRIKTMAQIAKRAKAVATECAQRLTEARKEVAKRFEEDLQATALPLGMKNLVVEIAVNPADLNSSGGDSVDFRFAFNKNQLPMPIKDTASGGEISRLMLAIKSILAHKMALPTIIFDEIDTGVSGDIAVKMGDMMRDISSAIQVIAITHLAQVAAKGSTHHKVYKQDNESSTNTHIRELSQEERIDELATMISGDATNMAARSTALSLIETQKT